MADEGTVKMEQEQMGVVRLVSLFTGTGMLDVGVHDAFRNMGCDIRTVMHCECDPFAQEIVRARVRDKLLDDAPVWPDVRSLDGRLFMGRANAVAGGFPCQDLSHAGKKAGIGKGTRSGLFFDLLRIAKEMRADIICLENVPAILSTMSKSVLDGGRHGCEPAASIVGRALHEAGYDSAWITYSAADVGAPHGRERWWCMAIKRVVDASEDIPGTVCDLSPEDGLFAMISDSGGVVARPKIADVILDFFRESHGSDWIAFYNDGEWESAQPSMFSDDEDMPNPPFWMPLNEDGEMPTASELPSDARWPRQGMIVDGHLYRLTDMTIGIAGFRAPWGDPENQSSPSNIVDDSHPTPVSYDSTPGGPNNHYKGLGHLAAHGGIYAFENGNGGNGDDDSGIAIRGVCQIRAEYFQNVIVPKVKFRFVSPATIDAMNSSRYDDNEDTETFATPKARDYRSGKGASGQRRQSMDLNVQAAIGKENCLLNPCWTEPVMCWPIGWTDVHNKCDGIWLGHPMGMGERQHAWEPLRITKKGVIQDRAARVKACGNGVVPIAATMAYLGVAGHFKRNEGD
jgi:site-specific DNA-cytosine methylase